jgi:hypothetical protein
MKPKTVGLVSLLTVILASILATLVHSSFGQWLLFPGVVVDILVTRHVHGGGTLSTVTVFFGAWLAWFSALYIINDILMKLSNKKGSGTGHKGSRT